MKKLISTTILAALAGAGVNAASAQDKVSICHNYQTISVAGAAVQSHLNHGDFSFEDYPEGDCEKPPGVPGTGPVTGSAVAILRCDGATAKSISDSLDGAGTDGGLAGRNCPQVLDDYLSSGWVLRSVTGVGAQTEYLLLGKAGEEEEEVVNPL